MCVVRHHWKKVRKVFSNVGELTLEPSRQGEGGGCGWLEWSPVDSVCRSHGFAWISLMMREGGWKKTELPRADRSDSSSLVYFISSVFCLPSFWLILSLLRYLFIPSLVSLWCPHCTALSWCSILEKTDKSAHRSPVHSLTDACILVFWSLTSTGLTRSIAVWLNVSIWKTP